MVIPDYRGRLTCRNRLAGLEERLTASRLIRVRVFAVRSRVRARSVRAAKGRRPAPTGNSSGNGGWGERIAQSLKPKITKVKPRIPNLIGLSFP